MTHSKSINRSAMCCNTETKVDGKLSAWMKSQHTLAKPSTSGGEWKKKANLRLCPTDTSDWWEGLTQHSTFTLRFAVIKKTDLDYRVAHFGSQGTHTASQQKYVEPLLTGKALKKTSLCRTKSNKFPTKKFIARPRCIHWISQPRGNNHRLLILHAIALLLLRSNHSWKTQIVADLSGFTKQYAEV